MVGFVRASPSASRLLPTFPAPGTGAVRRCAARSCRAPRVGVQRASSSLGTRQGHAGHASPESTLATPRGQRSLFETEARQPDWGRVLQVRFSTEVGPRGQTSAALRESSVRTSGSSSENPARRQPRLASNLTWPAFRLGLSRLLCRLFCRHWIHRNGLCHNGSLPYGQALTGAGDRDRTGMVSLAWKA